MPTDARVLRVVEHPHCVVCGRENPQGFQIDYAIADDGSASARWTPSMRWEGFKDIVHGGVLSTVMDEAMAKAVIAAGYAALTCELRVRFRHTVRPDSPLEITGWIVGRRGRRIETEATITHAGRECLHAWATFLVVPQR